MELVEIARFGDAGIREEGLDQRTIEAGAGVLGDIRGLTTGPDGMLWVLDRSWQKLAVFRQDGTFDRVVLGGTGDGPGEFRIPQDLTSGDFGVSVLDFELRRFTHFDWTGELLRVVSAPEWPPFRHIIRDRTMWVVPHHPGGIATGPIAVRLHLDGRLVTPGPTLEVTDQRHGLGFGVAESRDGRVLISTARPGVWMEYHDGEWNRVGSPRFPDDPPPFEERVSEQVIQVTPSQYMAVSIAAVADSLVIQGVTALPEPFDWDNPPERETLVQLLKVFDMGGEYVQTVELPAGAESSRLHVDRETDKIYFVTGNPFPQVVESELALCQVAP